ncbi:hypothetical protein [Roseinatronobacter sp.]
MTDPERDAIKALTQLLQRENAAIRKGDLAQIDAGISRKADLGATLDAAAPAIAEALAADAPDDALVTQITALRAEIEANQTLLDSMTQAAGGLVAELARIRDRHGLRGIYGATGTQRAGDPIAVQRFDRSV